MVAMSDHTCCPLGDELGVDTCYDHLESEVEPFGCEYCLASPLGKCEDCSGADVFDGSWGEFDAEDD